MSLAAGSKLGPYAILSLLGVGGMGEVYRARDTRLGREVALKVLAPEFSADAEYLKRFEREARSASALSDPHVVSVFDVGQEGAVAYVVTELVEGGDLRSMIERGALPFRQALEVSAQVAEGLAAAHEKGIVHRDLKPENILVTKSGIVKIADFGLARVAEPEGEGRNSQNVTAEAMNTQTGVVMGTVAYMSPEQARGEHVDFRSDQFSFGILVYELVTGRHPFRRATAPETLTAILREEPLVLEVPGTVVPAGVKRVMSRCLEKLPEGRYGATRDLARDLRDAEALPAPAPPAARTPRRTRWLGAISLAAAVLAAAAIAIAWLRHPAVRVPQIVRLTLPPPPGISFFSRFDTVDFAFSPDGTRLAFLGDPTGSYREVAPVGRPLARVFIRSLSDLDAHAVPGTEGATSLFWSPDGRSIGFFTDNQMKRVDLGSGLPVPVCDVAGADGMAGTWGAGDIIFGSTFEGVLYRVPAESGGAVVPILRPDRAHGETRLVWPQFLPGGNEFLYVSSHAQGKGQLMLESLDGRPPRAIGPLSSRFEYTDRGYLVFAREGSLFAQKFDPGRAKLIGPLIPIAPAVYNFYTSKWAAFAVSSSGTVAYAPRGNITRLTWFDRTGHELGVIGSPEAGETISLAISPDGHNAVFDRTRLDLGTFDIWTIDLARGVETRITSNPNTEFDPVWLPNGRKIIYSAVRDSFPQLVGRDLSSGEEKDVLPPGTFQEALDVTPDGRRVIFSQNASRGAWSIWSKSLTDPSNPPPDRVLPDSAEIGHLSPDGRLLLYLSSESGQQDLYVRPLTRDSQAIRVTTTGATFARWSRNGREIDYISPDRRMFAVAVQASPLEAGRPTLLFPIQGNKEWKVFDVAPDGRFLVAVPVVSYASEPLVVAVNGLAGLPR